MKIFAILVFIFSSANGALAYEYERAVNNLAHECCECSTYFSIGAEGVKRTGNMEGYNAGVNAAISLLDCAMRYSKEETIKARIDMAYKRMASEMFNDYANMSILIQKYGAMCGDLLKDTEGRLKYWLAK